MTLRAGASVEQDAFGRALLVAFFLRACALCPAFPLSYHLAPPAFPRRSHVCALCLPVVHATHGSACA